jgi:hypothetical protein
MNNATTLPLISNSVATVEDRKHEREVENSIAKIPYAETILEPTKVQGVKIPDGSVISSSPATIINNYQFFTSSGSTATGTGGAIVGYKFYTGDSANPASLIPNEGAGLTSSDDYLFGILSGVGSAGPTDPLKPWSNSPLKIYSNGFGGPNDYLPQNAASVRLVSMELECTCLGSNFSNQGEIIYGYVPPYVMDFYANGSTGGTTNLTTLTLKEIPGMRFEPIAQNKCWSARYCPMDPRAQMFLDMDDISIPRSDEWNRGCFVVAVIGGSTTQTIYDVKTTANYEFIPLYSGLSFATATPNQSDPIGMSLALNAVRQKDTTRIKPSMSDNTLTPMSSAPSYSAKNSTDYFFSKKKNLPIKNENHPSSGFIPKRPIFHSGPVSVKGGIATSLISLLGPTALNLTYKLFSSLIGKPEKAPKIAKERPRPQKPKKEKAEIVEYKPAKWKRGKGGKTKP